MPKSYLTLAERQNAENKRFNSKQDDYLRIELQKAKKAEKLNYENLAKKAELGETTVKRIFSVDFDLNKVQLGTLRKLCNALGIRLILCE